MSLQCQTRLIHKTGVESANCLQMNLSAVQWLCLNIRVLSMSHSARVTIQLTNPTNEIEYVSEGMKKAHENA